MNHSGKKIPNIIKLVFLGLLLPMVSIAQNQINISSLKGPVKSILEKYIYLSGEIRPDIQPDPARPFIQLFYNPRVQVYNDLSLAEGADLMPVRDYSEKIKSSFPEGLLTKIDLENFKIDAIPEDPENRMIVEVEVRKTVEGIFDGQPFQNSRKTIFMIGFDLENGEYRNFLIHGIIPKVEHDHDLILAVSPGFYRIYNRTLIDDTRFDLPWEISWKAGLHYQYMFNSSWGLRIGVEAARNTHSMTLDKFDPFEGHDPHLKDVEWSGDFYYLEIPVNAVYSYELAKRITLEARAGFFAAYRIFEEIQTSAINSHSGKQLFGVMSDPYEYSNIAQLDMGVGMGLGVRFDITSRISLLIQAGYRQGLFKLNKDPEMEYPYGIYQGQFNPLFYKTGSDSFSRSFPGIVGITYRIFGRKNL